VGTIEHNSLSEQVGNGIQKAAYQSCTTPHGVLKVSQNIDRLAGMAGMMHNTSVFDRK
jgi:hypothetical protein